jgi:hypothetical protein
MQPRWLADFLRLARVSLLGGLVTAAGSSSCIVASSPDYPVPEPRGPFVASVVPPTFQVLSVEASDIAAGRSVPLQLVLRSEDAGRQLAVVWYEDYRASDDPTAHPRRSGALRVPPGVFDESRAVTVDWTPSSRLDDGRCHSVTVVVTYDYDAFEDRVSGPAVLTTWWVGVHDPEKPAPSLDGCYGALPQGGPDAGAEGG